MAEHDNMNDESAKQQQQDGMKVTETLQDNIPIINFAGIDGSKRPQICHQIAEACETWGCFHLINHGIDPYCFRMVKDASMEFFHGSEEEKLKIKVQAPRSDGWNHCEHVSEGNNLIQKDTVEHLLLYYYPEREENFVRFPQKPASYRSIFQDYTTLLQGLGEKVLGILSGMLGLPPEAIQAALSGRSTSGNLQIRMRTNFYGLKEDGEALPNACHAHSDPSCLTILLADDAPGLEIRKDGQWVKVDPIPDSLIINVGDMLEISSNGRYNSVEHRGMPSSKQERLTLATFLGPADEAVVGPIALLLDKRHPPLYQSSQYAAYVAAFVKAGLDGKRGLDRYKLYPPSNDS